MPVPKVFGWQHIVYLIIVGALSAVGLVFFYKKAKEKTRDLIIKITGGVLLCLIIWNRIAIADFKDNAFRLIPDSLCAITSFGLGICAIVCKRDALPFHYMCYAALLGGSANVFYPYYVSQDPNFMLPATISGLLHHTVGLVLCIMLIMAGYFRPNLKKYYAFPVGLCFNVCYGLFLIDALGVENVGEKGFESAMNIFSPIVPNTFLTWYVVYPAAAVAVFFIAFAYEKIALKRKLKKEPAVQEQPAAEEPPATD